MNEELQELWGKFRTLDRERDRDELIQVAKQLIDLEPDQKKKTEVYYVLGTAHFMRGENGLAIEYLTEAIKIEPQHALAYSDRGTVYHANKEYGRAIDDHNKAIEMDPKSASYYHSRGKVYYEQKDYLRALYDHNKAIEIDPKGASYYNSRGHVYYRKKNYKRAIYDSNKAIELDPENAAYYDNRGTAYYARKEYGRAIDDYNKAIELDPKDASYYDSRGSAYYAKEDYKRALYDSNKAIELDPKKAIYYSQRGTVYFRKKDNKRALDNFNRAIKINSKNPNLYENRGMFYILTGDRHKARQDLTKAIKLGSGNALAFYIIGRFNIEKKNHSAAFKNFVISSECDNSMRYRYPQVYLASEINAIYKTNPAKKNKAFMLYSQLFNNIKFIQRNKFHIPNKPDYAHYASLHTLKKLVGKECFRLYNARYMNDPEEGQVFLKMISTPDLNVEETFYGEDMESSYISPAYMGSFVMPVLVSLKNLPKELPNDSSKSSSKSLSKNSPKDLLPLWRTYGKHDGEEAAGACVIFKPEHFATSAKIIIGSMPQPHSTPEKTKPRLYKVVYVDQKKIAGHDNFPFLVKALIAVGNHIKSNKNVEERYKLKQLVRELLDTIRFIFKAHYYKEEREVRVINLNYSDNTEQESDGIKIDMESIPPRFYVEISKSFRFREIILGPRAKNFDEWKRWINEHDKDVDVGQSEIKYGR